MGLPSIEVVGEHGGCTVTPYVARHRQDVSGDWFNDFGLRITHSGWWLGANLTCIRRIIDAKGDVLDVPFECLISFERGERITTFTRLDDYDFAEGVYGNGSIAKEIFPWTFSIHNCRMTFERAYLRRRDLLCDRSTGEMLRNANGEIVRGIRYGEGH